MNALNKWQTISFVSRMLSKVIGMIPSILIPRILSVSEFGLIGIAKSIGKAFGVTQNLGLASGSTRQISQHTNTNQDIFKIFVSSVLVKYLLSFPLAFAMFLLAENLAVKQYNNVALVVPLKIYAIVLVVQNIQSLFNSVVQGMQRFKLLFTYQVLITIPNVILFVTLVYFYGVNGYFYASLAFNTFASIVLGFLALWPLRNDFVVPSKQEIIKISKSVFVVSLGVYAAKIIYTLWEGIGPLVLGRYLDANQVGLFVFAALYAGQLMAISDSVTDVNLSVFSKEYSLQSDKFKELFTKNFDKIFSIVVFIAMSAIFWRFEIITLFYGDKYNQALNLIPPILFAFVIYSFINIVKSSIFVPANFMKDLIISYGLLIVFTLARFYYLQFLLIDGNPLESMCSAMLFGALASFGYMIWVIARKLKFTIFGINHFLVFLQANLVVVTAGFFNSQLLNFFNAPTHFTIKLVFYTIYVILFYFAVYSQGFFSLSFLKNLKPKK